MISTLDIMRFKTRYFIRNLSIIVILVGCIWWLSYIIHPDTDVGTREVESGKGKQEIITTDYKYVSNKASILCNYRNYPS